MRVGLDARPALHGRTGVARAGRELIAALRRRGRVDVLAYGAAWRRPGPEALAAVPSAVHPRVPGRLQALLAPLGFSVETLLGPLAVYQHLDLVFAPVRRAQQVLTVHDLLFLEGRGWHGADFVRDTEPRLRRVAARAARIVVPSAAVARAVVRHGLVSTETLRVIPWGGDHVSAQALPDDDQRLAQQLARCGLPTQPGRPLVLALGAREPRKNHAALLEAFLALPSEAARLLFVGPRGWGCPELEARLRSPALRGRVGVADELGEADLSALLRRADVVAYPSLDEGFGFPALEALRCGRALLTSRDTPMAELAGEAALLVDPASGQQLRAGLAALIGDAALRARLGAEGERRARPYTWDACAAAHEALYEELARTGGAAP
ncbi:MAG: glycosyltransferase family 4 protein [Planctomycetota bacterium]